MIEDFGAELTKYGNEATHQPDNTLSLVFKYSVYLQDL